jgi:hypothetical protein
MKKHASVYWAGFISITTAVVCLGVPWNLAVAQPAPVTTPAGTPAAVTSAQGVVNAYAGGPVGTPAAATSAEAPGLPYGVSEVVKMYQGGINKDVLINYIENTVLPFHLTADGIIYLQHLGMPQEVTSALIRRDGELQKQAMAYQQQQSQNFQQPPAAAAAPYNQAVAANPPVVLPSTAPPVVMSPYPQSAPPVVYPDYSAYPYPYYGYPYYYGPDVIIGGGFGWGWGRGGFGWGGRGFEHGGFGRSGFSAGHGGFGGHH